jgi:hypothetical protein
MEEPQRSPPNVDMRVANGAIPRMNSVTPTIDELIQELTELKSSHT